MKIKKQTAIVWTVIALILILSISFANAVDGNAFVSDPTNGETTTSQISDLTSKTTIIESNTVVESDHFIDSVGVINENDDIQSTTATGNLGELVIHLIDVGQADSILIQQQDHAMLIDAGNNADANLVVSFIQGKGIEYLDYVIGTHPHEDHIGGLDAVIESLGLGKIILPDATNNTKTFEDVLLAIQAKGLKITKAVPGNVYQLGAAVVTILGPAVSSYDDLNDSSVVCRIDFGDRSFLFMGDAERASETAMITAGFNLDADVLKVGHHGSNSSTSEQFLKAVTPDSAVICVGEDNDYGHPRAETLDLLASYGVEVYRTDLAGTITIVCDGSNIIFSTSPNPGSSGPVETAAATTTTKAAVMIAPTTTAAAITNVYITETGSKYHRDGCRYLSSSKIAISLEAAIAQGFEPCSVCDP